MQTSDPRGTSARPHPSRPIRASRAALALVAGLTTAGHAAAQIALAADPSTSWSNRHGTDEALIEGFATDLDRDGSQDLVFLTNQRRVVLSRRPAEIQDRRMLAVGTYAATLDDVALQPAAAGSALLTANPNGVHRWHWDDVGGGFEIDTIRAVPDLVRIACAGRTSGMFYAAYALAADERTVYPMIFHAGSGLEAFPLQAFALEDHAAAIAAFDLQGDGMAELAVVLPERLEIRALNGSLVAYHVRSTSEGHVLDLLGVLMDQGSTADQLAWSERVESGTKLHVVSQAGLDGPFDLGERYLSITGADLDADGLADLALVPAEGPKVRTLRSIASGNPRFSLAEPNDGEVLGATEILDQGAVDYGAVAAADLDRDGDMDLAFAAFDGRDVERGSLTVVRGTSQDHTRMAPRLFDGTTAADSEDPGVYHVEIKVDEPLQPETATRLRWRVWRHAYIPLQVLDEEPLLTGDVQVPQTWPYTIALELEAAFAWNADWTIEIVLADTLQTPVRRSPPLLVVATMNIELATGANEPAADIWGWSWSNLHGGGGSGGVGEVPRVPPPPPEEPDDPPTTLP